MTIQFLVYAAIQLGLFVWLVRIYRWSGAAAALLLIVPQFFLFYDNFMVAIGSFIGIGDTLKALSWPRFWVHWLAGMWLIIACGSILRLAEFKWAENKLVMASFCVLTVGLMFHDLPNFWSVDLYPVCESDTVRYTSRVAAGMSCTDPSFAIRQRDTPLAVILACYVVILTGAVLLVGRRWPWLWLGGVLMLTTATVPALRAMKLDNFGEVLIAGSAIWTIAHFAGRRRARAPARPALSVA